MKKNYRTTCSICGSENISDAYLKNGFTICHCHECLSFFVKDTISKDSLSVYYQDATDEFVYDEANVKFLDFYFHRLRTLIENEIPNKGKILDIGCSSGYFLDVMEGWQCFGNEISPMQAVLAKQKHGDNIQCCDFEDYISQEDFFDVITLQDCLDHFIDPVATIDKARKLLKKDGVLIVKVHNIGCLWAKLTKENFYAIIPPYHLQYFTTNSLCKMLTKFNFKISKKIYIPHLLKFKTVFYRLSKGSRQSFCYKIYKWLDKYSIGNIPIYKNLHDIITIIAKK